MSLLERIGGPRDLKALPAEQLPALAEEIRAFLVDEVSRTGGHLGPNLGVVELTIALHRVFDSPKDAVVFDTGHQSYVHKLLTGRQDFSALRKEGGLSGYPSRGESEHDVVENSHASTSLSWADGIATADEVRGERDRHIVAVIGDGALTGGMAWEALNNIAAARDRPLVIVVNDNERSYAPTIGGLADHLATLRTTRGYERFLAWGKRNARPHPGRRRRAVRDAARRQEGPQGLRRPAGHVRGPRPEVRRPDRRPRRAGRGVGAAPGPRFGGPVIVHGLTQKGRGYEPAEQDEADRFHAVGVINPETGLPLEIAGRTWTDVFADAMVELGEERDDVVAITAAMLHAGRPASRSPSASPSGSSTSASPSSTR